MEGIYLLFIGLAVIIVMGFFLLEWRWKKALESNKTDPASQTMWLGMQNQMEQLRGQMSDGLARNISQLTQQQDGINAQLRGITDQVNRQLLTSSGEISKRLDNAARVIGDVQKNIGELSEASRRIFEVGKDIATLQEILQPPKLRGGLGEQFLGELLSQIIPAENVDYETITKDEAFGEEKGIFNYALKKKVIPVSPNSFFAYLQVIVFGLRGLKIEKDAQGILNSLAGLNKELEGFPGGFQLIGKNMTKTLAKFEDARRRLDKFNLKLEQIESQPSLPFK